VKRQQVISKLIINRIRPAGRRELWN